MSRQARIKPLTLAGVTFRNKAEAACWARLMDRQKRGEISCLAYEPATFHLGTTPDTKKPVTYTPDFLYIESETEHLVALEVKGFRQRDVPPRLALFNKVFPWIELVVVEAR